MDVYLRRTYYSRAASSGESLDNYPFWDYRSCRQNSKISCPGVTEDDVSSMTERAKMAGQSYNFQGDVASFNPDPCPVTLHIITDSQHAQSVLDLYQQVINWVDPKLKLFHVTERTNASYKSAQVKHNGNTQFCDIPAIAMTIFLGDADQDGDDSNGLKKAQQLFQHPPWRLHHSEKLGHNKINSLANNSHDFYYTSHDLPLWAARYVHYGREHIRYVLYVSDTSWPDQVNFYRLILSLEADLVRDDFCLFTVYTQHLYDVQFALKKLDSDVHIRTLPNVHMHVKVKDSGHLVPLFPNVCHTMNDGKWQTTDHDGNVIVIDASPTDSNTFTMMTTNNHSEQTTKIDHNFKFSRLKDINRKKNPHLFKKKTTTSMQFALSELSLNIINDHAHQFESPVTSDSDDFGIDLPSPPLRHISRPEEDEESLTLTNTSDESGIQMQQGCEDLSLCEDDGLRSCLSKNSSLKVRHVKFKVRFKEEVQTFEDPSRQPSPCYESDDHIEAEMKTKFPYVPSSEKKTQKFDESSGQATNLAVTDGGNVGLQTVPGNHCNNLHTSLPTSGNSVTNAAQILNKTSPRCHQNIVGQTQTRNNSVLRRTLSDIVATTSNRRQPLQQIADPTICPLCQSSSNVARNRHNTECSRCLCCSYFQCSICRSCNCFKNQTSKTTHREPSSNEMANTCSGQDKKQQTRSRPSSKITQATNRQNKQHINRSASEANILRKMTLPATPLAVDNKIKHFSDKSNALENKSVSDSRFECNPSFQMQHVQNGQKRFWFADTNLDLAQSGCSGQEETTLKFTLKYDTCPTSGLSSGQEQIGFYV